MTSITDQIIEQAQVFARASVAFDRDGLQSSDDSRQEAGEDLRDLIAAALADARREGAEAMLAGAFDACVAQADADRRFAKSERNAGAVDCATELAEIIRALPLPTGKRQAVLLTDEQVQHVAHTVSNRFLGGGGLAEDQGHDWDSELSRAIESAVLAANGLEVRRG